MKSTRILFVCLGNICRSPMAEGVLGHLAEKRGLSGRVDVDSAGTGSWHSGEAPDQRSVNVARRHGIDISGLAARKILPGDFSDFDLILAMDRSNLRDLARIAPPDGQADLHLFWTFATGQAQDVADPYYDDEAAFEAVYTMLLEGCDKVLDRLEDGERSRRGNTSSVI